MKTVLELIRPKGSVRLPRVQFFEFIDQAWLPQTLRTCYLDSLNLVHKFSKPYRKLGKHWRALAEETGSDTIQDLGSGGAQHVEAVLALEERLPHIILSDRFISETHFSALQDRFGPDRVSYLTRSFSVADLKDSPAKAYSICTALHHFKPEDVRKFFSEALTYGDGFLVYELCTRRMHSVVYMLLGPPLTMLTPFFAKRFSWVHFFFCCICPIIPLLVMHDGVVSVLRSYTEEELRELLPRDVAVKITFSEESYQGFMSSSVFMVTKDKGGTKQN